MDNCSWVFTSTDYCCFHESSLPLLCSTSTCFVGARSFFSTHFGRRIPASQEAVIVGQGDFRYQMVPGWGMQNANGIKLGHCQAVAEDRQGRILLLNTSEEHCMLILGTDGGLLDIWGVRQTHR